MSSTHQPKEGPPVAHTGMRRRKNNKPINNVFSSSRVHTEYKKGILAEDNAATGENNLDVENDRTTPAQEKKALLIWKVTKILTIADGKLFFGFSFDCLSCFGHYNLSDKNFD